jgi:hypothetical protein
MRLLCSNIGIWITVIIDIVVRTFVSKIVCRGIDIVAVIASEESYVIIYIKRNQRRRGRKSVIVVQSITNIILQTLVKILVRKSNGILVDDTG